MAFAVYLVRYFFAAPGPSRHLPTELLQWNSFIKHPLPIVLLGFILYHNTGELVLCQNVFRLEIKTNLYTIPDMASSIFVTSSENCTQIMSITYAQRLINVV
ncbi:hypothetical protein GCM10007063_15310 [Lentibacillus kapialis]|uniref:Uncharacterized protein n=1 Tax=Lentibacillus kapialis TaxID=340214 RepID=A0A917PVN5_9BACI|nr:hypothetical protein GCM10007063_15310 [Lentibacillus kapialis]